MRNHFVVNFWLHDRHGFSLTEINEMIPFEREIYVSQVHKKIREASASRGIQVED